MTTIEVIQLRDYLTYFSWGRHSDDPIIDMRLGGGSFALHRGDTAFVIDTMTRPGQGAWVRNYLETTHRIKNFTLISSHWHFDHIVDNIVYANDIIIGHERTRELMLAYKDRFEAGTYGDSPAFKVALPNLTFTGDLELWLDDLHVILQTYAVHEEGHLGLYLPDEKLFIANDILEDPIWFFDFGFASPEVQISELERLLALDVETIYPCHGSTTIMKAGGYDKSLIQANMAYLQKMQAALGTPDFETTTAQTYMASEIAAGTINWWHPYTEVHDRNKEALKKRLAAD